MTPSAVPTLIVTGPVGVGKTRVAYEVANLLEAAALPHACIDMDTLRSCYPRPVGDRFNVALGLKNLGAVWENCRRAGATHLILADVVESPDERAAYRAAVPGAELLIARLRASPMTLAARVSGRDTGIGLEWNLRRSAELAAQMDRDQVEDFVVETDERSITVIAQEIVDRCGWLAAYYGRTMRRHSDSSNGGHG